MIENKRLEMVFLIALSLVAMISAITILVGFFIKDGNLIIQASKFLSLSTIILLTNFAYRVYNEIHVVQEEIQIQLKSKEDVEDFKKQIDEQLQKFIKDIAEEEEKTKE